MSSRSYCTYPSIRNHWVLRCISGCPVQMVSLKRERDSQSLSPIKLGTHISTHRIGRYARLTDERQSRPCPAWG
ncbi:hypothetical protein TNCV_383351 [Trichonephila clavipes]|nr:hypothetical protein TNCV_383351 [Trichonephila clavipes]